MNRATERWEYDRPPRINAETAEDISCPSCGGQLQWQDELNLACLDCESGYGLGGEGERGGQILSDEFGHPAAEVIIGDSP